MSAFTGAWRAAASAWLAFVAAVVVRWAEALREVDPRIALPLAVAAGIVVLLLVSRALPRRSRQLRLVGDDWQVAPVDASDPREPTLPGRPVLALDLGRWLLVRFDVAPIGQPSPRRARSVWLPLSAASDPAAWPALRVALWTWRAVEAADAVRTPTR